MSRYYPLTVDCLEERCVPDADPLLQTVAVADATTTTTDTTDATLVVAEPTDSYVIDPYLIDPNAEALPPKPPDQSAPVPDSYWSSPEPTSPVPPISDPFWY